LKALGFRPFFVGSQTCRFFGYIFDVLLRGEIRTPNQPSRV